MAKGTNSLSKGWFTDGPTITFPARQRIIFWLVNLILYALLNMFALRLQQGVWFQLHGPYHSGPLIEQVLYPLNILQFPSQIIVVALLTTLICSVAILMAQLYGLLPSVPFIVVVFFLGHNPILSMCLLVSCAAVSFEPMRFKSKFVSAVVCLLPQVLYWVFFSGENREQDVLRWAILYAPWALAFVMCVVFFGIVLAIGHFLRYRPGVLMPIFAALLALTVFLFHSSIGMDERDFQADVFGYSPEQITEFESRSIIDQLKEQLAQRRRQSKFLTEELILAELRSQWRWAFRIPLGAVAAQKYDVDGAYASDPVSPANRALSDVSKAQLDAIDHIDGFIKAHRDGPREADAMYYKGLLIDMKVDHRALRDNDVLQFYFDFPSPYSQHIWAEILSRFPSSPASIEAGRRLALLLAGRKPQGPTESFNFKQALSLLEEAQRRCAQLIQKRQQQDQEKAAAPDWYGTVFRRPDLTIANEKLKFLQMKIARLSSLISQENRTGHLRHEDRLAAFVRLDSHEPDYYERQLAQLKRDSPQPDPLIDNIELALTLLEQDPEQKLLRLAELAQRYQDRDGGIEATLELALALLDQGNDGEQTADRRTALAQSREQLLRIIKLRPDTFFARYAQELLENHPLE